MKTMLIILILLGNFMYSQAQCNEQLIDLASAKAGDSAIIIRDFSIRLNEASLKKPLPIARYKIILNKGITYRLTLANAAEYEGVAIAQLYFKADMLASTFNTDEQKNKLFFDYTPRQTDYYQLLFSFDESKEGCAAAVLSIVPGKENNIFFPTYTPTDSAWKRLYLGIDNKITLKTKDLPLGILEASVNQGIIKGNNGNYIIRPSEKGKLELTLTAKDVKGNVLDNRIYSWEVVDIPLPKATVNNQVGGLIMKSSLYKGMKLEIKNSIPSDLPLFDIVQFVVSKNPEGNDGIISYNQTFTFDQLELISSLSRGNVFYIRDIKIRGIDNQVHDLPMLGFIIGE